jgi:hypothetical protein
MTPTLEVVVLVVCTFNINGKAIMGTHFPSTELHT